jgi:hypothetical protein
MDSTRMVHTTGSSGAAVRTALEPTTEVRQPSQTVRVNIPGTRNAPKPSPIDQKPAGYGLPCAKCKTYYLANLSACPICKSTDRVSPVAMIPQRKRAEAAQGQAADNKQETILRDLKTQLSADAQAATAQARCRFAGDEPNHKSASICKTCYEDLEERLDLYEAALHMDLNEAAQVIYDAVWADTSDSNKTYLNAARALLAEIRKRAGLNVVLSSLQTLPH